MKTASRFAATLALVLLGSASHAALVNVGNGLVNHPAANLSWVADANLFRTMAAADSALVSKIIAAWTDGPIATLASDGSTHTLVAADFDAATGRMNWYGARAWANYLRTTHYKGYSDWRLPELGDASLQSGGCTACIPGDGGFAIDSSEWWRLYFQELGGTANVPIGTSNNGSYSLFQNIEGEAFWGYSRGGTLAALFRDGGVQTRDQTSAVSYRAWPVRVGQSIDNPPPAPYITFLPESPSFAITPYNTTASGDVRLRNVGNAAATISSITATGDFSLAHNCGTSLAANASCVVNLRFTPTALLDRTGTLSVNGDTVFTAPLFGTGGISATLSASALSAKEGKSLTLTWTSSPNSVCQGIGGTPGWAGPLMSSGSRDVSSPDAGSFTYAIRCTHDAQVLPAAEASTTVYFTNVAKGSIDWALLVALALALSVAFRARSSSPTAAAGRC